MVQGEKGTKRAEAGSTTIRVSRDVHDQLWDFARLKRLSLKGTAEVAILTYIESEQSTAAPS